jgi:hypothetical protein
MNCAPIKVIEVDKLDRSLHNGVYATNTKHRPISKTIQPSVEVGGFEHVFDR